MASLLTYVSSGESDMSRSKGVAEECVKEMKKIIRANISGAGILNQSSALAGLIMFRNTPRSPTDLSPAQILFGHPIRDNLPHRRNQLVPTQRFEVERRLQDHRQREAQGTQRELPILHPGQRVRVQDPRTKQWSKNRNDRQLRKEYPRVFGPS